MEQTATSLSNLQTRAFALLRKWMKKGSLDETETHELVEIQKEIPTASLKTERDSFKDIVETRFDSVDTQFDSIRESLDTRFDSIRESLDTRFDSVDAKFDAVDAKFDAVSTRIDSVKESLEIRFSIVLRWLKILTGVGVTLLLAMASWLIRFLVTGGA